MRIFSSNLAYYFCGALLAIAPLSAEFISTPYACGCHGKDKHPKTPKSEENIDQLCKECSFDQTENSECQKYLSAGCDDTPETCRECLYSLLHRMNEDNAADEENCEDPIVKNDEEDNLNPSDVPANMRHIVNMMTKFTGVDHHAGYFTSHPGAVHWLAIPGLSIGNTIQIEDLSIWRINPEEAYRAANWSVVDQIVIYNNYWWRSGSYPYLIENVDKGTRVQADIQAFLDPMFEHTIFHHWIFRNDPENKIIWLEDGTRWLVNSWDYSSRWHEGQTIILGINTGINRKEQPNILINANLRGQSARAVCLP